MHSAASYSGACALPTWHPNACFMGGGAIANDCYVKQQRYTGRKIAGRVLSLRLAALKHRLASHLLHPGATDADSCRLPPTPSFYSVAIA